jgi:hypothetical protein
MVESEGRGRFLCVLWGRDYLESLKRVLYVAPRLRGNYPQAPTRHRIGSRSPLLRHVTRTPPHPASKLHHYGGADRHHPDLHLRSTVTRYQSGYFGGGYVRLP